MSDVVGEVVCDVVSVVVGDVVAVVVAVVVGDVVCDVVKVVVRVDVGVVVDDVVGVVVTVEVSVVVGDVVAVVVGDVVSVVVRVVVTVVIWQPTNTPSWNARMAPFRNPTLLEHAAESTPAFTKPSRVQSIVPMVGIGNANSSIATLRVERPSGLHAVE